MEYVDVSFADPASNLACDEALLNVCESGQSPGVLRTWEPQNYFVVIGYSNKLATEVYCERCRERGVPILRRFSGGGTVLQGPGCVNYSLVLSNEILGSSVDLVSSYRFVLERHRSMCAKLTGKTVAVAGTSDLAIAGKKFSGNAQHRKRRSTLFHGTFLLNFDLPLISELLPFPSKQPDYRQSRAHEDFLCNLETTAGKLKSAIRKEWNAKRSSALVLESEVAELVESRYRQIDWNEKF